MSELKRRSKEVTKMPGFDGTGPSGYGPLSGRRGGRCRGSFALRRGDGAEPIRRGSGIGEFGRGYRNVRTESEEVRR